MSCRSEKGIIFFSLSCRAGKLMIERTRSLPPCLLGLQRLCASGVGTSLADSAPCKRPSTSLFWAFSGTTTKGLGRRGTCNRSYSEQQGDLSKQTSAWFLSVLSLNKRLPSQQSVSPAVLSPAIFGPRLMSCEEHGQKVNCLVQIG